jgi:hypothetical protein
LAKQLAEAQAAAVMTDEESQDNVIQIGDFTENWKKLKC